MFSFKKKLDYNLRYYLQNNCYSNYRVLIKYRNFEPSICKKILSYKGKVFNIIESIKIISAQITARGIEYLLEYPEIEKIFLDDYLFLCGMSVSTANSTHFSSKNKGLSGCGVGIGLVDSGVYPHHNITTPSNRIEDFTDLVNGLNFPYDDNGHGTCISGILCNNSTDIIYKGICPKSKLYCFKAFDKLGKGFASDILFAIDSLINISHDNNIKILCLPFESLSNNSLIISLFHSILHIATSHGMIPIVAAGSVKNNNSILGISTSDNCISVGGIDYEYSSHGKYKKTIKPDLLAACQNIVSLNCDCNYISERDNLKLYPKKLVVPYKNFSGTSIATAYICGLCSLVCEKKNDITFSDIKSLLNISCISNENDKQNNGKIIDSDKLLSFE